MMLQFIPNTKSIACVAIWIEQGATSVSLLFVKTVQWSIDSFCYLLIN